MSDTTANSTRRQTKIFLTTGEVARLLGCTSWWVINLIRAGKLDTQRISGKGWHRIPSSSLENYARSCEINIDWSLLQQ